MATRNNNVDDDDQAYNRDVLRAIRDFAQERDEVRTVQAETRTALTDLRRTLYAALNLVYTEVQELRKAVKYWQWATIIICAALLGIVAIALTITWYVLVHAHG